jgi:hypothetical protein
LLEHPTREQDWRFYAKFAICLLAVIGDDWDGYA